MLLTRLLVYYKRLQLGNSQKEGMPRTRSVGKGTAALPLFPSPLQQNSLKEFQELPVTSLPTLSSHSLFSLFQSGCRPPHSTVTALVNPLKDPQVTQLQDPFLVPISPDAWAAFDGVEGPLPSENALLASGHLSSLVFLLSG